MARLDTGVVETVNLRGMDLIESCLSAGSLDELSRQLIFTWRDSLLLDRCGFAWYDAPRSQWVVRFHARGQFHERVESCLPSVATPNAAERLVSSVDSSCSQVPLFQRGIQIGLAFYSPEYAVPLPDEWLRATSCLLTLIQQWDAQLHEAKLQSLVEFAAGAGHEINNPLAAIRGRTHQLFESESDPQRRQLLQTIGAQVYRIRDMIGDTMLFAAPPQLKLKRIALNQLLEKLIFQFLEEFRSRHISLWGNREDQIEFDADETQLSVVICELLRNALQAVEEHGRIEIDCETSSLDGRPVVMLRIRDNGCGLSPEQRRHCFDPFYSGRQAGRGLGFGLSKCWRIITSHGGTLSATQTATGMTEFVVVLPQFSEQVATEMVTDSPM